MIYGLDEIYNDLLLEAKTPEEIKKILEYQFVKGKGVPQYIFDEVFKIDPTKKKSYTKWVLMQWEKSSKQIETALKHGTLKEMFSYFQERANTGLNLVSMPSFEEALIKLPNNDPVFAPISADEAELPENDFDVVYDSPEWKIAVPHTYEADKKLGMGCRWCTAGAFGDSDYHFKQYTSYGPLWVNFDKRKSEITPMDNKEYPYTRYQFCFEARKDGELMDKNDKRVDLLRIDLPESVMEFYKSKDERYYNILSGDINESKLRREYEAKRLEKRIDIVTNTPAGSLFLLPFYSPSYELHEDDEWGIFSESDLMDPLYYYAVDKENPFSFVSEKPYFIVPRSKNDHVFRQYFLHIGLNSDGSMGWETCEVYDLKIHLHADDFIIYSTDNNFYLYTQDNASNRDYRIGIPLGFAHTFNWQYSSPSHFIKNMHFLGNFENNKLIQVDWSFEGQEFSSLFEVGMQHSYCIIKKDWPKESLFKIGRNERGVYAEGEMHKYYIQNPNEDEYGNISYSDADFELEEKLITNDGIKYVVLIDDEDYFIYNPITKKTEGNGFDDFIILNRELGIMLKNYRYGKYEMINYKKGISYPIDIDRSHGVYRYSDVACKYNSGGKAYIFHYEPEKISGPFNRAETRMANENNYMIKVLIGDIYKFINLKTGEINETELSTAERGINSARSIITARVEENIPVIYDIIKDKIVCCDYKNYRILTNNGDLCYFKNVNNQVVIYSATKGQLLAMENTTLLENVVDNVFVLIEGGTKNGRLHFYKINGDTIELKTNPSGIPLNVGKYTIDVFEMEAFGADTFAMTVVDNTNKEFLLYYNMTHNAIDSNPQNEELINTMNRVFFSQQSQVYEHFKSLINRMNNL